MANEVGEEVGVTPFELEQRAVAERCVVVRVRGEIDMTTADRMEQLVADALAAKRSIVLDLRTCEFLDSTGIAVLVKGRQRLDRLGERLCVFGAPSRVDRVLDITGLKDTDLVQRDLEAALAACHPPADTA